MRRIECLAAFACLLRAQILWDDDGVDARRTEYITETGHTYTTVLGTPIEWSTALTTVHVTPKPTTSSVIDPCDDFIRGCTCPGGYRCEFESKPVLGESCPKLVCRPSCLKCPDVPLKCDCRDNQICAYQPGRCFKCPHTSCIDVPQRCIECPLALPNCSCKDRTQCTFNGQTCDRCAHYTCDSEDACPPVASACTPPCSADKTCSVRRDKISGCMTRLCVPKNHSLDEVTLLADACLDCTTNEECQVVDGQRKCVPKEVQPCLTCPAIDVNLQCGPHEHLVIEPNTCDKCGHASCVPDSCYNCFTFPIPIPCGDDEDSVLIPPSCYDCGRYTCVKKSQPEPECLNCNGSCVVTGIENGLPLTECVTNKCVECPGNISCNGVECSEGSVCKLTERTCDSCPKATCIKKRLEKCAPASCAATLCPVDTQCIIREFEGECPRAECVNPDDCIICPQAMPTCDCPDQSHCQFAKQNCFQCAHYMCVQPPKCPPGPSCEECPKGYNCEKLIGDAVSCPSIVCRAKKCLSCSPLLPRCANCDRDEVCRITIGNCEQCATSECKKNPDCLVCPKEPRHCTCKENEEAIFKPGSCHECPSCVCVPKTCLDCPDRDVTKEDCAKCKEDERCEITPRSCYSCEQGKCVSKCVRCDPRLAQCDCKPGETCRVTPGTCETCPVAICEPAKPACKPVKCTCKLEETLATFTDDSGCPNCKCLPLTCEVNQTKFPVLLGKKLSHVCVNAEDILQCNPSMPQCTCEDPSDCVYEPRTFESCADYKCRKKCKECPAQAPPCQCSSPSECVLQSRTCNRCGQYYCRDECVSCPEAEPKCPCKDPNDCVLRPRTCLFCPYYECLPPSKRPRSLQ